MSHRPTLTLFLTAILAMVPMLSGCTSLLEPPVVEPKAEMQAYPIEIESGGTITFDARGSDPVEGVITEFNWDFGDGNTSTTLVGFTSHRYADWGTFVITLEVINDQGGEDTATQQIHVNGAPQIVLATPSAVKAGDVAIMDAAETWDPEGAPLTFAWDLDWSVDTSGDGDPRNDVDSGESQALLETNRSGNITGALTVTDERGSETVEFWTLEVQTRHWTIEWTEQTMEVEWEGYLDEGDTWESVHIPAAEGRLMSVDALLELDRDIIEPQDNFTLRLSVPVSGWYAESQTSGGNVTTNESASASIERDEMNPIPEGGDFTADSESELIQQLLNAPGARFGQGEWTWYVLAEEANPDPIFPELPDPDPGNNWKLSVTFTILIPNIIEV